MQCISHDAMKVLRVHNRYGRISGEDITVDRISELLVRHGHDVKCFAQCSAEISGVLGKASAFFGGIYSFRSRELMRRLVQHWQPDIVHVHNVFPLISPSVLGECRRAGVPVVMTVHNHRLVCPNGLQMVDGRVCERCLGGREYWCVVRNCEGSVCKSLGYALRTYTARRFRLFQSNVTMYAPLTEFHRSRLISQGVPSERIAVIPNMVPSVPEATPSTSGEYVAYIGRVSREKGIESLLAAAATIPDIPFKIAGAHHRMADSIRSAPCNVHFLGHLGQSALDGFYAGCRVVVLPSICYETFGLPLAEAGVRGRAVICSRIAGLGEIVEDGVTGVLFEPGNADELSKKIRYLWDRPALCKRMGQAGRKKVLREYSPEKYYERLIAVYEKAIELGPPQANS